MPFNLIKIRNRLLINTLLIGWLEIKSYLRDRTAIFWTFIYPVVMLVVLDYIFNERGARATQSEYSAFLVSGMAAMTVLTTALFGFAAVLVSLRHEGKLKMYEVIPLHKLSYLLGFALSRLSVMVTCSLVFVVIANIVYSAGMTINPFSILNYLLLTIVGGFLFISVSFILVSFISSPSTATALINIISIPILFLSDLFIPMSMLPDVVQKVTVYSPVYLFVDASRDILVYGKSFLDVGSLMAIFFLLGVVSMLYALKRFSWSPAPT